LIKIPNSLTYIGTYVFTLTVTNFLGKVSLSKSTIDIKGISLTPYVSIAGVSTIGKRLSHLYFIFYIYLSYFNFIILFIVMNRKDTLSLFANAQIPSCPGAIQEKIFYTWSIYKGTSFISSLTSISRDPRSFKLNSYALDSSSIYTAMVQVYAASSPNETSSTTVSIQVGKLGVKALIAGGSSRSASSEDLTTTLDASNSYDIDYPTDSTKITTYSWTCSELSPNFGDSCLFMDSITINSSKIEISGVDIKHDDIKQYLFTVFVKNSVGSTSSATTEMTVLAKSIPTLLIEIADSKYNSDSKIILTGSVTTTRDAYIKWFSTTIDDVDLIPLLVTPIDKTITTIGVTEYQLAIAANSLTPGLTYTFQIGATYEALTSSTESSLFESLSQINIIINEAPKDGTMVVTPVSGKASTTVFLLSTLGWSDDDDTIFRYVISYYAINADSQTVVKNKDFPLFVESKLGQGLESSDYAITCSVVAYDSLDSASAPSTTIVTVSPNTNSFELANSAKEDLEKALIDNNPEVVSQVTGAVTSSINSVNCTFLSDISCSSLNREECSTVAHTCGNCLADYPTGASIPSNTMCFSSQEELTRRKLISSVGSNCAVNGDCFSGYCDNSNVCSYLPKTCSSDCSNNGDCIAYNYYNNVIDNSNCNSNNHYCRVSCACRSNWYGNDCSQTLEEINNVTTLREALAKSLYDTLAIQDVTSDVVISRATNIANILKSPSELSENATFYCAQTLISTIINNPELAGSSAAYKASAASLSSVLNSVNVNSSLIDDVSNTLQALTSGIQSTLALGEDAVELIEENIRLVTSVVTGSSLSTATYSTPLELDENDSPTTIIFETNTDNSVYLSFYSLTLSGGIQSETGSEFIIVPTNYDELYSESSIEGRFSSSIININVDVGASR
jgi:hypothetical protein